MLGSGVTLAYLPSGASMELYLELPSLGLIGRLPQLNWEGSRGFAVRPIYFFTKRLGFCLGPSLDIQRERPPFCVN